MSGESPALQVVPLLDREPPSAPLLARLGGKAGPLRQLAALGYPVWPGVVLLPPGDGGPWSWPESALVGLPAAPDGWAVRSSAGAEDGRDHSFAGQYTTRLHVPTAALEATVAAIWAADESPALARYRQLLGAAAPEAGPPPLLLQPMLPAAVAGVAFGADPVSGRRGVTLVQAVAGVAADLLAGRCSGDRYCLAGDGRVLEQHPLDPGRPLLAPEVLQRLQQLLADLERQLGGPQDVEWALDAEGRIWLLQVRPITRLGPPPAAGGAVGLWDNSNIVESYSGVTTPLTFSFARKAYTEVYAGFCRFMGVEPALIRRHRGVLATMIGFHNGRIYYNLQSWYRVLSLLPGYRLNAPFLEQMLGVQQPLETAERDRLRLEPPTAALGDGWRLLRMLLGMVGHAVGLERRRRAFRRRLDRVLLTPTALAALAGADPHELVQHYRRLEGQLLSQWDAPLINDFFAMVVYGVLGGLLRRWRLDADGGLLQAWISDLGAVVSAEPHRRIAALGRQLAHEPDLVRLLATGGPEAIARGMAGRPWLQAEIDSYLEAFGDRCLGELKLETRTLRDDPLPLLRSLAAAAGRPDSRPAATVVPTLPRHCLPAQRWLLGWLRRRLRRLLAERENLRFERTRVFGQARRLLLTLGRRYAEQGVLERADDAVFLEVEELLALVEGTGTCTDLRGLAALRQRQWLLQRAAAPLPRRFETHGLPHLDLPPPATAGPGAEGWQGLGCSPGRVQAAVERVGDPLLWLEQRRPGTEARPILVAQATDPGWVLLFPHAAGLLVERGSALSHVAIVAREVGLPMVTELAGIAGRLVDGDRIEIDGASGRVRLLARGGDG